MARKAKEQYTFLDLAIEVLDKSEEALTINEIWEIAEGKGLVDKICSSGKTPLRTLAARIYVDIRDNKDTQLKKVNKRPATFCLKDKKINDSKTTNEYGEGIEENNFKEKDLHVLLSSFVYVDSQFMCQTKTIHHEKSPKNRKGVNEWLHPDIVGVHFPDNDYSPEVVSMQKMMGEEKHKIYSFEMKKKIGFGNIRECYFQAVSNSSWANEGYLVALEVDSNEDFLAELRRLNNAFGIGIIKLNAENISQSEVLLSAKPSDSLDWDTIDKLSENPDFKEFLTEITSTIKRNRPKDVYDKVFSTDEECREYAKKKKIMQ